MTQSADYERLIDSLDLPAKVRLLTGASGFTLAPNESIGLAEIRLSDGPTGVRGLRFADGKPVALFPNATLLASSWSEDTAYEVGWILAEEALAQQIHVVLGPTINLHRSPLGGRLFEAYSEDPLLTGKLAAAYVRGLQENRVGACLKHLVANESETLRNTMNSVVDQATLREVYLLPFEIAVADADPWSMMAAYNDVNGTPATEHRHVIEEIVKGEWGYPGLVMSDWYATKSAGPAATGGLDLVMPGPIGPWGPTLVAAVEAGKLAESVIDEHLRRLLRLAERVGALGKPRGYPVDLPAPDSPVRKEQLTRLAAQGMTVLTNREQTLPISRDRRVALIGRHAVETICMGGGSAQVTPPYQISVADGLTSILGGRLTVTDGVEVRNRAVRAKPGFVTDPETGEPGTHALLYAADGAVLQARHQAGAATTIAMEDVFPEHVTKVTLQARIEATGPVEVGVFGAGEWQVAIGDHVRGFNPRSSGEGFAEEFLAPPAESTVIDVRGPTMIEATVRPDHPLGITQAEVEDAGAAVVSGAGMGTFGLIARPAPRTPDDVIAEAVHAARQADVAVVVVGLTEEEETESVDKTTLHLPGAQDALIEAVAAAARSTIVVVNAATPVIMPWLDRVDAVLWAGLPGQEGGHAIAAALLGDIEPAGRLVTTFPAEDAQSPAWSVNPTEGDLVYAEGPFLGYRGHFADKAPPPAFWFGHGLGYTEWDYAAPKLAEGDRRRISVEVTNVGARPGREVVQVYYQPSAVDQPVRLVGWTAIWAAAGESVQAEVATDHRLWRRWDTATNTWQQLPAGGQLLVARGLGDIRGVLELAAT
ncbi:MAG: glycoside hydrolase family 3 C-terminal domain-containing protein [Actinomycetota bacterium]|nr:glycoside hydrolase family 3 C-terminal domain-containing protein [Actinomycetota bacterium]